MKTTYLLWGETLITIHIIIVVIFLFFLLFLCKIKKRDDESELQTRMMSVFPGHYLVTLRCVVRMLLQTHQT